jgi:hypothetical protein
MRSVFDDKEAAAVRQRLSGLRPDATPKWGKMDCEQMLSHVADGFRMAIGELEVEDKGNVFTRSVVKFLILNVMRMPKNVPTAPELDQFRSGTPSESFETSRDAVLTLLETAISKPENEQWGTHAIFGNLTKREWGALGFKHIDHHLRQFGV